MALIATALPLLAVAGPASAASAPARPHVPAGVKAGYVVFDRQTGRITAQREAHRRFRSASVVKIMIAIDYLESHPKVPKNDLALLGKMLRVSDDDAATSFWTRGGRGRIVERTARRLRLTDTAPPPADKPGFWGYTSLSAMDVTRTYRYLLDAAAPRVRDLVLGHLRNAGQCGSDGFDQYFGIPRAAPRPWAVKQGWSGYGSTPPVRCAPTAPSSGTAAAPALSTTPATAGTTAASALSATAAGPVPDLGHPVLHTTGLVGRQERWIMVLLTAHPSTATWRRSTEQTTRLAREVYLSGTS
ncbi:lipoprotein [Streptosporangium carneum]|uniref:Lipoprotein n=2 Tax=Streptosporangium carneum TaxID=47481 RepID=A0A9W6I1Z4_9ACTN|nr:lipoprotein [Streptosporangium carneum]